MTYDAIILGSAPNELVAAAYLAKAGKKVLVLEPRAQLGGVAALEPFADGFRAAVAPAEAGWIPDVVLEELGLAAHGFDAPLSKTGVTVLGDGRAPLTLSADAASTKASIRAHSERDAERWDAFAGQMGRLTAFLESLFEVPAVELMTQAPAELARLAGHGLRLRRMGKTDMVELLRVLPMSLRDLLEDWFECDALRAAVAATGLRNLCQGPLGAGTGFTLLHAQAGLPAGAFGARRVPRGEAAHFVTAMAGLLRRLGVEVRTQAPARIRVEAGLVKGVSLGSSESIDAPVVVSGADARRTFLGLMDPWALAPEFVRPVKHIKLRGVRSVLRLAVDKPPAFRGVPQEALEGTLVVAQSLLQMERAYDAAKHGDLPAAPVLEVSVPSIADASLAPQGKHVVHVAIQYTPYLLRARAWDERSRAELEETVLRQLEAHAPGLGASVVGKHLLTPPDLEREYGLSEGHLFGGELTLDQILFMRPVPGYARARTPIEGLLLSGATAHPGGAIAGLSGRIAARAALA